MAKITQKQIEEINNKCKNNWKLDISFYLFHNEKTLIKEIKLDEEHYLRFSLNYNYKNQIILHINKYEHEKGQHYACANGLGKLIIVDETKYPRKNINNLIKISLNFTDEELLKLNKVTKVLTGGGMFLPSEDF